MGNGAALDAALIFFHSFVIRNILNVCIYNARNSDKFVVVLKYFVWVKQI